MLTQVASHVRSSALLWKILAHPAGLAELCIRVGWETIGKQVNNLAVQSKVLEAKNHTSKMT